MSFFSKRPTKQEKKLLQLAGYSKKEVKKVCHYYRSLFNGMEKPKESVDYDKYIEFLEDLANDHQNKEQEFKQLVNDASVMGAFSNQFENAVVLNDKKELTNQEDCDTINKEELS